MTPQQVNQIQASFRKLAPIADRAAALFYARLFEMAPETRAMFRGDMDTQGRKLMAAIATVVNCFGHSNRGSLTNSLRGCARHGRRRTPHCPRR